MESEKINILLVEDDMIIGTHISMVLNEAGYAVAGIMPTGEAALSQIETLAPDLILMDVELKGRHLLHYPDESHTGLCKTGAI